MNDRQKILFVSILISSVLSSTVSASLPERNEYFVSPITGEKYLIYKNLSSRTYTFTSSTGQIFTTKKEIIEFEIKEHPEVNYKLDKYLQNLVENASLVPGPHRVTVYAKDASDNRSSTTRWFNVAAP